jgi:hypothetical protein
MTKRICKCTLIRAVIVAAAVLSLLAETYRAGDRSDIQPAEAHRLGHSLFKTSPQLLEDRVGLKLSYRKRKSSGGPGADSTVLVSQQAVSRIVGELKKQVALPFEIKVVFAECGGPDSYYDEGSHEIMICYELIEAYYEVFSQTHKTQAARDEATKGAIVSMFLHEVGHALIHGWNLPITGREEDAADEFSTLLLINRITDGDGMAMDGARSFKLLADLEKGLEKDYTDPHSFDEQRFFNTICLVYGGRPQRYEYLVRNGSVPEDRAFDCEVDYARAKKSWQTLLAPHVPGVNTPSSNSTH